MAGGIFSPRRHVRIKNQVSNPIDGPSVNNANQFQTLISMSIKLLQTTTHQIRTDIIARAGFGLDDK